jgi:hypothetical protein
MRNGSRPSEANGPTNVLAQTGPAFLAAPARLIATRARFKELDPNHSSAHTTPRAVVFRFGRDVVLGDGERRFGSHDGDLTIFAMFRRHWIESRHRASLARQQAVSCLIGGEAPSLLLVRTELAAKVLVSGVAFVGSDRFLSGTPRFSSPMWVERF